MLREVPANGCWYSDSAFFGAPRERCPPDSWSAIIRRCGWERTMLLQTKTGGRLAFAARVESILLGIAVVVAASSFVYHAYRVVPFPYELANGEELLLRAAVQIARDEPVYSDVNDLPFIWFGKPPLFPALAGLLIPPLGKSLVCTRLLAALSSLLTSLVIIGIIRQAGRGIVASATCGIAYLGSIFVYQWGAWGRVDPTALLFSLLAILAVLRRPDRRGTLLAAFGCLLSLYTKHTQWAAPIAIVLWLVWRRQWRDALAFVVFLVAVGGALFLLLCLATQGQFFLHVLAYNAQAYSYRAFLGYWRAYLLTHGGIVAVALLSAVYGLRARRLCLPLLYFVTSALMTVTVGRVGASSNHFLELVAATMILVGVGWHALVRRTEYASVVIPAILLLQLVWFKVFPFSPLTAHYPTGPSFGYTPRASDVEAGEEIDRFVKSAGGEILTEGGGFALRNGKELYANPLGLSILDRRGLAADGIARLEHAVATHRFSLVILTWQSFPPSVLEAVWANYNRVDTVDCVFRYEIFLPAD